MVVFHNTVTRNSGSALFEDRPRSNGVSHRDFNGSCSMTLPISHRRPVEDFHLMLSYRVACDSQTEIKLSHFSSGAGTYTSDSPREHALPASSGPRCRSGARAPLLAAPFDRGREERPPPVEVPSKRARRPALVRPPLLDVFGGPQGCQVSAAVRPRSAPPKRSSCGGGGSVRRQTGVIMVVRKCRTARSLPFCFF